MSRFRAADMYAGPSSSTADTSPDSLEQDESPIARTVFVGNIDARVTRKLLYELMLQAGPVEAIRLVPPRETMPRTIAFVRYEHAVSVRYAMLVFQDVKLFRSSLALNYSGQGKNRPRPDYPPAPTTFFEVPPGFEDATEQEKSVLVKRKIAPDVKEYYIGYYAHSFGEERGYDNSYDARLHSERKRSEKQYDRYRSDQRDYEPPSSHGKHSSSKNGHHRDASSYANRPPRPNQHIVFSEDDSADSRYHNGKGRSKKVSPAKAYSRHHDARHSSEKNDDRNDRHRESPSRRKRVRSRH